MSRIIAPDMTHEADTDGVSVRQAERHIRVNRWRGLSLSAPVIFSFIVSVSTTIPGLPSAETSIVGLQWASDGKSRACNHLTLFFNCPSFYPAHY